MIVDKAIFRTERGVGPGFFIASLVAQIVLGILASAIVAWFSRQREFRADRGSAELLGTPQPMVAALSRLGGLQTAELPQSFKASGIAPGISKLAGLFSSHPPIERGSPRSRRANHGFAGIADQQRKDQQVRHASERGVGERGEVVPAEVVEQAALPGAERHAGPAEEHHHADRQADLAGRGVLARARQERGHGAAEHKPEERGQRVKLRGAAA